MKFVFPLFLFEIIVSIIIDHMVKVQRCMKIETMRICPYEELGWNEEAKKSNQTLHYIHGENNDTDSPYVDKEHKSKITSPCCAKGSECTDCIAVDMQLWGKYWRK